MTPSTCNRRTNWRRVIVAGALASATAVTLAMPTTALAAPTGIGSTVSARSTSDPVAAEAVQALATLQRALLTRDTATMTAFDQARNRIAAQIASRLLIDPLSLQTAWQHADREHQVALLSAFTQLGVPYRRNSSKPGEGFDCSGLTTYAWGQAGLVLQRQSTAQIRAATPRTELTAQAGDLVQYPGHVMIWLGVDRAIVHAPYTGRTVEVDHISARRSVRWGDPTG
jgi:cell wall-associated NlpC family hydrolase